MNVTANTLADTFEETRNLTRFYLSQLKAIDPNKETVVDGFKLNSVCWIAAHLAWAEDGLINVASGKASVLPNDFMHYSLGSSGSVLPRHEADFKSLLNEMKTAHEATITHLRSMSDDDLLKSNRTAMTFGPDNSVKMMVIHAIRHEGTHIGNLAWLCKFHGLKVI